MQFLAVFAFWHELNCGLIRIDMTFPEVLQVRFSHHPRVTRSLKDNHPPTFILVNMTCNLFTHEILRGS